MPIPTTVLDLSATIANNSPAGSESPTDGDNYIRALSGIIRQEHDAFAGSASGTAGQGAGAMFYNTAATYATATVGYWLNVGGEFLQAGTGAVSRTGQAKMREIVSVKDFGAVGNGAADDTAAIQAAINSFGAGNGCVHFPAGTYLVTSTLVVSQDRIHLYGDGEWATTILFAPTANDTCIEFNRGSSPIYQCSLRRMSLYSNDSTWTKVGLDLFDARTFLLESVSISGGVAISGSSYWAGNAASIGVRTRGREFFASRSVSITADKPYSIAGNPNDTRDIDHFNFVDQWLIANANPCVTVEDEGVNLSNVHFGGYQSWNRGTHGFYWVQTVAPDVSSVHLTFNGVRTEQGTSSSAHSIHIEMHSSATLQDLTLQDFGLDSARDGIYLRRVEHITLDSVKNPGAANVALDITAITNTYLVTINCLWNTGSTATLTNLRAIFGAPNSPTQAAFANGEYGYDGNASRNLTLGGALSETAITVADNGTADLGTTTMLGKLIVVASTDNAWAEFNLRGTNNVTAEITDPQGLFSHTEGNAGTTNVYWHAGSSRYRIQNLRGGSRTYRVVLLGTYN